MRFKSRETPEAFGTSLLDMMTCSLGGVILVFVLKTALERGVIDDWQRIKEHQQEVVAIAAAQKKQGEQGMKRAADRIQRGASGSIFGLPKFEGKVNAWRRTAGKFHALGTNLNSSIVRSMGAIEVGDGYETPVTTNMLCHALQFMVKQGGGTILFSLPMDGSEPTLAEVADALDGFSKSLNHDDKSRQVRIHTVGFAEKGMLERPDARRFAMLSQYLSMRYGGVFIGIPTE